MRLLRSIPTLVAALLSGLLLGCFSSDTSTGAGKGPAIQRAADAGTGAATDSGAAPSQGPAVDAGANSSPEASPPAAGSAWRVEVVAPGVRDSTRVVEASGIGACWTADRLEIGGGRLHLGLRVLFQGPESRQESWYDDTRGGSEQDGADLSSAGRVGDALFVQVSGETVVNGLVAGREVLTRTSAFVLAPTGKDGELGLSTTIDLPVLEGRSFSSIAVAFGWVRVLKVGDRLYYQWLTPWTGDGGAGRCEVGVGRGELRAFHPIQDGRASPGIGPDRFDYAAWLRGRFGR